MLAFLHIALALSAGILVKVAGSSQIPLSGPASILSGGSTLSKRASSVLTEPSEEDLLAPAEPAHPLLVKELRSEDDAAEALDCQKLSQENLALLQRVVALERLMAEQSTALAGLRKLSKQVEASPASTMQ
eukprot:CAMPEP_0178442506 /NCGR_PEP_ID=MMETSP0689_2-20121128/38213_1 /TAXON_ID=160604 /ORGANISM="Amphidinium massartii, Strain CS-259" /LENGTH=130 /DNA_ID=CAMNT_0020066081 /DNA_START=105 /DNA_END=497 /DNA_ORIENTATION=-